MYSSLAILISFKIMVSRSDHTEEDTISPLTTANFLLGGISFSSMWGCLRFLSAVFAGEIPCGLS